MIASKKLTAERIAEIEKMPIVYDDDSPQLKNLHPTIENILILCLKKF